MIFSVAPCVSAFGGDRVDFGGVDEIDARRDRPIELRVAVGLRVLLAEGHRAEAERGDLEVGAAEAAFFHHVR